MAIDKVDELKAPRTFEVMQRQDFDDASQRLLQGFDEAEAVTRSLAAEGMIEATRGMESGAGTRLGAHRRASKELLDQFAQQNLAKGQTELGLIAQRGEMGDLSSDRMLKIETYDDLIKKMVDNGFDDVKVGRRINRYIQNEKDQFMVDHLMERGANYLEAYNKSLGAQPKPGNLSFGEKVERGLESAFSFIPGIGDD
tara:strand:+ start:2163 stop:2756 length:594 start_codon:yes stop_codon:yes gene_type:complete